MIFSVVYCLCFEKAKSQNKQANTKKKNTPKQSQLQLTFEKNWFGFDVANKTKQNKKTEKHTHTHTHKKEWV